MITDGKPSCVREKMGAIIWTVMALTNILLINVTVRHNKLENYIPITTFMIANDPYLQQFVKFTEANQGKAFLQDWKDWRDDFWGLWNES
jgi:uncharacterized protein with von Willebrand factor type A (vWA) domain